MQSDDEDIIYLDKRSIDSIDISNKKQKLNDDNAVDRLIDEPDAEYTDDEEYESDDEEEESIFIEISETMNEIKKHKIMKQLLKLSKEYEELDESIDKLGISEAEMEQKIYPSCYDLLNALKEILLNCDNVLKDNNIIKKFMKQKRK